MKKLAKLLKAHSIIFVIVLLLSAYSFADLTLHTEALLDALLQVLDTNGNGAISDEDWTISSLTVTDSVTLPSGNVATLLGTKASVTSQNATLDDAETLTPTAGYDIVFVNLNCESNPSALSIGETGATLNKWVVVNNTGTNVCNVAYVAGNFEYVGGSPGGTPLSLKNGQGFVMQYQKGSYGDADPDRYRVVINNTSTQFILGVKTGVIKEVGVSAVDGYYDGTVITRTVDSGATYTVFGQAYHIDTDGELIEADADVAAAAAMPVFCLAVEAGTGSKKCLTYGTITETDWDWTIGGLIYASDDPSTTCGLTQTAPSTEADQVQILGVALSADTIFFNPSQILIEVPAP